MYGIVITFLFIMKHSLSCWELYAVLHPACLVDYTVNMNAQYCLFVSLHSVLKSVRQEVLTRCLIRFASCSSRVLKCSDSAQFVI